MKKYLFGLSIFIIGCNLKIDNRILGTWKVQSNYYDATYKIEKQGKKLIGKVIYYNDGTTILRETKTQKDVFLKNLKYKPGSITNFPTIPFAPNCIESN